MASLPYISSPGNIDKALNGIKAAAVPERVSQEIPSGSGDQMTTFLKKLGFANSDGSPNEIYKRFRNPASSGQAIATAIKAAYAPLYVRNEFMHELPDVELVGLVVEETGLAHDALPVKLAVNCIKHLKAFATFGTTTEHQTNIQIAKSDEPMRPEPSRSPNSHASGPMGLNLGYTINLNLPATSDPAVFDAIFKSLKEHLLRNEDAQ
jgi:hypothetical protein